MQKLRIYLMLLMGIPIAIPSGAVVIHVPADQPTVRLGIARRSAEKSLCRRNRRRVET